MNFWQKKEKMKIKFQGETHYYLHIGYTVLHIAVMGGYTETASFLIEKVAKIDSKTLAEETPLYRAAY